MKREMEMPCLCDCGEWFDLNDGYKESGSNKVVCEECHKIDKNAEKRLELIYSIGIELDQQAITFNHAKSLLKRQDIDTTRFKTKQSVIEYCCNVDI